LTNIHSLIARAREGATRFPRATQEQALTYSCEQLADDILEVRIMVREEIQPWIEAVCHTEDLDIPDMIFGRKRPNSLGVSYVEDHAMCLFGREIRQSTVLHELAHLSVKAENHGVLFRDELVRLTRAHLSVDYAALLHSLFVGCNLEAAPWGASARQY
jgi:hypothetical protein